MKSCNVNDSGVCESCGRVNPFEGFQRQCITGYGLGDMVAAGLSSIGITKERVSAVVGGECGCQQRQEALNKLGRKIGIG
jgi:hypothetical protein